MSADDPLTLARRAVACKRWRWMPGMLALWVPPPSAWDLVGSIEPLRVTDVDGKYLYTTCAEYRIGIDVARGVPDLTDPATLGCLLALVREALPAYRVWACPSTHRPGWEVLGKDRPHFGAELFGEGATEAEALVSALEEAPQQEHQR